MLSAADAQRSGKPVSGMFITFEGPEGAGKSTQVRRLVERIRAAGRDVELTREPGGTPIGEAVRQIVLAHEHDAMALTTEVLLFAAARAQSVAQVIRPALERGAVVVCDRYLDSTLAYQGYGQGIDLAVLRMVNEVATGGLQPDLTCYLAFDDVSIGIARKQAERGQAGVGWDRLDARELAFHRRVAAGFDALMTADSGRWRRYDATLPREAVTELIWGDVAPLISGSV
jgi:dTMP kinase